jgi:LmbE family N-acetylglucosaminyl deacetylase
MRQNGWRVIILTATKGGLGGPEDIREEEEKASIASLSLELHQGTMQDGALEVQGCLHFLNKWVNYYEPAVIFTHAPEDTHQDHITLTRASVIAARRCPCLLYYEGPSTRQIQPVLQIDVSSVWPTKIAALLEYQSQLERLDLIRWAESVAHFRSWPDAWRTRVEVFQPERISFDFVDAPASSSEENLIADLFLMSVVK